MHHGQGNLFLILSDSSAHAQSRINIYGSAAPEGASIRLFGMSTFSPLWPT
jgi:hypothetical protein